MTNDACCWNFTGKSPRTCSHRQSRKTNSGKTSKRSSVRGTEMKTLSADDLLFSLCVHGSRHLWERLGWICDIAELITRHEINWPALLQRAAATDSERMFLLGLHLAHKLLDAPLPSSVQQRCDRRRASRITRQQCRGPSFQRPNTHSGHIERDLQIQHRRAQKSRRACALFRTHVAPDRQRFRRSRAARAD